MSDKFILNETGEPIAEPDVYKWAIWFEKNDRRVGLDQIGNSKVSTVFLALDHNFSGRGGPILWETMVFGGPLNEEQDRCAGTRSDAQAMHKRMVERVKGGLQ